MEQKDVVFSIELLPAKQGDAIWIEYGSPDNLRRILIDAGPIDAFPEVEAKLKTLEEGEKRVELVVLTHVDNDHIEGMVRLFAEKRQRWLIAPEDIWFNGYRHMDASRVLGGREGDFLSALLHHRSFDRWNRHFRNKPVMVVPNKPLPIIELEDGMTLTLLSPDPNKLKRMANKWGNDVAGHGLRPGDLEAAWEQLLNHTRLHPVDGILGGPDELDESLRRQLKIDQSPANGSCIAFLAEYHGKSCLFLGDAHASLIVSSLRKLIPEGRKRLKVDVVKVSHHGSRNNISQDLLNLIDAKHYLVSTNGAKYRHPDAAAMAAIIQGSVRIPVLWFNYKSEQTLPWRNKTDEGLRKYYTRYPPGNKAGVRLNLIPRKKK